MQEQEKCVADLTKIFEKGEASLRVEEAPKKTKRSRQEDEGTSGGNGQDGRGRGKNKRGR